MGTAETPFWRNRGSTTTAFRGIGNSSSPGGPRHYPSPRRLVPSLDPEALSLSTGWVTMSRSVPQCSSDTNLIACIRLSVRFSARRLLRSLLLLLVPPPLLSGSLGGAQGTSREVLGSSSLQLSKMD